MSNEQSLNSNEALVNITSDYEYILGKTMGQALDFKALFHSNDFLSEQLEQIRYDLEDTAKLFAEQQGLAPGARGWGGFLGKNLDGSNMYRYNTGTLYHGIKAVRSGRSIHLRSEARDQYGHYYGGHVEFGHQNVPPRPHLRPALQVVSEASRGKLRSALHNLLTGAFSGDMTLGFGRGGGLGAFYYRKGAGEIRQYLTTGTRGQQMKYHFGSIRSNTMGTKGTRGISRKASSFRSSFSRTAKKQMGWGKQKSLSPMARQMYRRLHTSSGRKMRATMKAKAPINRARNRARNYRNKTNSKKGRKLRNQIRAKQKERLASKMRTAAYIKNMNVMEEASRGYGSVAGQSYLNKYNSYNAKSKSMSFSYSDVKPSQSQVRFANYISSRKK